MLISSETNTIPFESQSPLFLPIRDKGGDICLYWCLFHRDILYKCKALFPRTLGSWVGPPKLCTSGCNSSACSSTCEYDQERFLSTSQPYHGNLHAPYIPFRLGFFIFFIVGQFLMFSETEYRSSPRAVALTLHLFGFPHSLILFAEYLAPLFYSSGSSRSSLINAAGNCNTVCFFFMIGVRRFKFIFENLSMSFLIVWQIPYR